MTDQDRVVVDFKQAMVRGEYGSAVRWAQEMQRLLVLASWVLPMYGRIDETVATLESMVWDSAHIADFQGMLGVAYAKQGNRQAAQAVDGDLATADPTRLRGLLSLRRARVAAQGNDREKAVRPLEQAFRQGTWFQPFMSVDGGYWHTDPSSSHSGAIRPTNG